MAAITGETVDQARGRRLPGGEDPADGSRTRALNDSIQGFCQGEPVPM
jgi:hypothetical protein